MDGFTLRRKTFLKTAGFFGVFWLFIFVPAWPPDFWEGWVYWLSFLLPMVVITLYFLKRDPDLIWRRISTGPAAEPERRQMIVRTFAGIMYFCMLILAGLDHRAVWSGVSPYGVIAGDLVILAAFYLVFLTFRENRFTNAIIIVEDGQTVISTGPYAVVRHPLYAAVSLMVVASPFALGSLWALIPAGLAVVGIVLRLMEEEKFLSVNLPGYSDYCKETRFRLIPGVW